MRPAGRTLLVVAALLAAGVVLVAVLERAEDPRSSPVIAQEDPYTHMVFVREHVDRGEFGDSERVGTKLYPPGMHALVGVLWQLSGADLYELARWFPLVFGALAAWGTFALLRRAAPAPLSALVGAALGAWIVATNPEHVVRGALLWPTALDLALLPWSLLGFARVLEGERRAVLLGLLPTLAAVLAHPWIAFILAGAVVGAALLAVLVLPAERVRAGDAALAALACAGLVAFAASTMTRHDSDKGLAPVGWAAAILALAAAGLLAAAQGGPLARLRGGRAARIGATAGAVAAVAGAWAFVLTRPDLPLHVNYARMLAPPLLLLASVGAVLAVARPSLPGLLGLGVAAVTFPFTVVDWFDSWYLPHRTMVYVVAGSAILAGHALFVMHATVAETTTRRAPAHGARAAIAVAVVLLAATPMAVAAGTPDAYVWGRYYEDEDFEVLRRAAERLDAADGREKALTASWVPHVVLGALGKVDHAGYDDDFFHDADARQDRLEDAAEDGLTLLVVVDEHTRERAERKGWDLGFVEGWEVVDRGPDLVIYRGPSP